MIAYLYLIIPRAILALLSCSSNFPLTAKKKWTNSFFKIAVRHNLCLKKDFYYNRVRFLFNRVLGEKKRQEKKKPRNISKSTLIQIIVDLLLRSKKPTKFLRIRDLVVVLPCLSRRLVQSTGKKYVALYWKFWNCCFLKSKSSL